MPGAYKRLLVNNKPTMCVLFYASKYFFKLICSVCIYSSNLTTNVLITYPIINGFLISSLPGDKKYCPKRFFFKYE